MNRNQTGIGYIIVAIAIVIASLISMIVWSTEGERGLLHSAQSYVSGILSPVRSASNSLSNSASLTQNQAQGEGSSETYAALREQIEQLTSSLATGEEYRQEAIRLQELLNLKDAYSIDGISAHVIGRTTDAWNQTCTLDIGESSGSFVGATVCSSDGVVGQVSAVTETTSTVRLITDPQSGVAALVQSSRDTCVVQGSLDGLVTASNFSSTANVGVGDIIITSGLGGSFTKGIIIGTVTRVSGSASDGSLSAIIGVNETSNFEECLIVKSAIEDN